MSAYNELQSYFDAYQGEIRKVINSSGRTLSELAELSGVPYNYVCDISAGRAKRPSLYYSAAICKVFRLSLNKLMGLDEPEGSTLELRERNHELEIKITELKGEIGRMEAIKEADEKEKATLSKELSARKPIIYILLALCGILAASLTYYLIMDFHLANVGLILFGEVSIYGAILILVLAVSGGAILWIAVREMRTWRRDVRSAERGQK